MIFDSHCHTEFSPDSIEKIDNYIKKAKEEGIGFIVTEHLDINFRDIYPDSYKEFDPILYRDSYKGRENEGFLVGIECGLDPSYAHLSKAFIDKVEADFVLGSIHSLRGKDIYPRENFLELEKDEFWKDYFTYGLECLKSHKFINSLAHIDYPCRYNPYNPQGIIYKDYKDYINPLFKYMGEEGIALELNLRRFWNRENIMELEELYRAFKDKGGSLVTLGTDSHSFITLGKEIRDAFSFMEYIGLKVVHFEKGKAIRDIL